MFCFHRVGELRMAFIILNDWKIEYFKTWKLYDSQISVSIKFYWNTDMLIYLHIVYDCLHYSNRAEQFNRHYTTYKNLKYLLSGPLEKNFSDRHYIVNFYGKKKFFYFCSFLLTFRPDQNCLSWNFACGDVLFSTALI